MSDKSFDLIDEPWIGVRDLDGAASELGIRDVLRRSHEIAGLTGDIPTQVFAVTRLLLAVMHRALEGPDDVDAWAALWKEPHLPASPIDSYLEAWRHRFDLLHPDTPFFQVADLTTSKGETSELSKLIADVPNGVPFFTTRLGGALELPYAEAARWLVHCQAFDPSGIKSGCVGDERVKGGRGYPIGVAWSGNLGGLLAEGSTLRETLLLNLRTVQRPAPADDLPAWERPPATAAQRAPDPRPTGPVDLFTWQARRVRLHAVDGRVRRVLIGNGDKLPPQNRHGVEPHTGWRRSANQEKALGLPLVYMPQEHVPERSIWRGLASMLPRGSSAQTSEGASRLSPGVVDWLSELVVERVLRPDHIVRLRAIGMVYGSQSSVTTEVVDDALAVRSALLGRAEHLVGAVESSVESAEKAVQCLTALAGRLAQSAGGDPDGPRARARERAYAELDRPFRAWVVGLHEGSDAQVEQGKWHRSVRGVVAEIARDLQERAPLKAWRGRVDRRGTFVNASLADAWFRRDLAAALPLASLVATPSA